MEHWNYESGYACRYQGIFEERLGCWYTEVKATIHF